MGILICIAIGAAIAFIVVFVMKGQLKTVRPEDQAGCYIARDSFRLTHSRDLFLYRTVTRSARPKNNSK